MFYAIDYGTKHKLTPAERMADAIEKYSRRFGHEPSLILTNPDDAAELAPVAGAVEMRPVHHISRGTLFIGVES